MARPTFSLLALALCLAPGLDAQQAGSPAPIRDNSFLLEEAYNQDARVVQHISTFSHPRTGSDWAYSFTQEWPVASMRHQLSATIRFVQLAEGGRARRGAGDVALNYRYQLAGMNGGALAIAPRVSMLLPTGRPRDGLGLGGTGVQVNLPVSLELSERLVTHLNAGVTYTRSARSAMGDIAPATSYNVGQSLIWLASPTVNLMLEAAWTSTASVVTTGRTEQTRGFLLAPGIRWAHNLARGLQIVPGAAYPIGLGPSRGDQSLFTYLSFEHPF